MNSKLLTMKDVCERLRVSRPTIYNEINAERLKTIKIGNRRMVSESAIQAYISNKEKLTKTPDFMESPTLNNGAAGPAVGAKKSITKTYHYPDIPKNKTSISNASFFPDFPGIYFLWDGMKIIYVGQTNNIKRRIIEHRQADWARSLSASYIGYDRDSLLYAESYYIGICRPKMNAVKPNDRI